MISSFDVSYKLFLTSDTFMYAGQGKKVELLPDGKIYVLFVTTCGICVLSRQHSSMIVHPNDNFCAKGVPEGPVFCVNT